MLLISAYSKVVRYVIRQTVLIRCCFVMSVTVVRLSTFLFALILYVRSCPQGFHMDCLDPPIATVPADNWFCYNCLSSSGGDFGFDEGEEHSLSSFQARDLEFRRIWFQKYLVNPEKQKDLPKYMCNEIDAVKYNEYDVEEEFWRLVQSQQETVEIEYGADIHSATHGRLVRAAFPIL